MNNLDKQIEEIKRQHEYEKRKSVNLPNLYPNIGGVGAGPNSTVLSPIGEERDPANPWKREGQQRRATVGPGIEVIQDLPPPRVSLTDQKTGKNIELGWKDGVFTVTGDTDAMDDLARAFIGAIIARANGLIR